MMRSFHLKLNTAAAIGRRYKANAHSGGVSGGIQRKIQPILSRQRWKMFLGKYGVNAGL
jgi:hypothetical protein